MFYPSCQIVDLILMLQNFLLLAAFARFGPMITIHGSINEHLYFVFTKQMLCFPPTFSSNCGFDNEFLSLETAFKFDLPCSNWEGVAISCVGLIDYLVEEYQRIKSKN